MFILERLRKKCFLKREKIKEVENEELNLLKFKEEIANELSAFSLEDNKKEEK